MNPFKGIAFDSTRQSHHDKILATAQTLHEEMMKIPSSREHSLAITNLEQSILWIGKALKSWQIKDGE